MLATSVAPSGVRRSHASKVAADGRLVGEDVGVIPFGAGQDRERRVVGVEVAGVLVGLDDECGPRRPSEPWPAGHP